MLRTGAILKSILDDARQTDDGEEYEKAVDKTLNTFDISKDKRKKGSFRSLGRRIVQWMDGTVFVTVQTYFEEVKPLLIA